MQNSRVWEKKLIELHNTSYHDASVNHYVMHSLSNISCMDQIVIGIFVFAVTNFKSFSKRNKIGNGDLQTRKH